MEEKFGKFSKGTRVLIVILTWLFTVVGFGGCLLVKHFTDEAQWAEILLTGVGLFFCVLAVCLTISDLTIKAQAENSDNSL